MTRQQSKNIPTVGVLWHASSAEEEGIYLSVLVIPAENPDRFRTLARELVDKKPDAIIAVTVLGAVELKKLIPIVFVVVQDPIGLDLSRVWPGRAAMRPARRSWRSI